MHQQIIKSFDRFREDYLLCLDIDCAVIRYPALFDRIECDIANHYRGGVELLAGTTFLRRSDKVKHLCEEWAANTRADSSQMAGQTGLARAISAGNYDVYRLPAPYTLIFDTMRDQGPPVIEHYQASRQLRARNAQMC